MLKKINHKVFYYTRIRKVNYFGFLFFLLTFLISANYIFAKPTLQKIQIDSLNHIICYFDQVPTYISRLDSTKYNLTIEFKNTFISNQVSPIENRGIIQRIYFASKDSNLILNIQFKEKQGYTTLIEPFSQRIIINVFNWLNLSKSDDLFNTGLLALEDSLYNVAENYLRESALLGNPKAAAILAMIYSNQRKINRTAKYSELGKFEAQYFPDINNILANIYKYKSDSLNFARYKNEFEKQTGKQFVQLYFASNIASDTLSMAEAKNLDSLIYYYQSQEKTDSANPEFSRFNKLFDSSYKANPTSPTAQKSKLSSFPLWLKAVIGVVVAFLIVLIYQYFRWRNLQLRVKQSKQKEQIKKENQQPTKASQQPTQSPTISPQMFATYMQNQATTQESKSDVIQSQSAPSPVSTFNITEEKVKQISDVLENIKATKEEKQQIKPKSVQPPLSAKLELALNLTEEQKRIKQQKIEETKLDLSATSDKLKSTAQKLGLEENTIEIKQAIANLITNKSKLEELQSKFESRPQKK